MIRPLPAYLSPGAHQPNGEMCVMEAVAWVAGESWSDTPACACPVISRYCQVLNDQMGDEFRARLLAYVPRLVGTRSTPEVELRRAFRAADWAVRRFAPPALEAAGLKAEALQLQELSPIVDEETARAAAGDAWAAREAARAAGDGAGAAWAAVDAVDAGAAAWAARAAWAAVDAVDAGAAAWAARAAGDLALLCLDDLLSIAEVAS